MQYLKLTLCVIAVLCASRFIPHPPNFTGLIALGLYIPASFGLRYIPSILIALLISDIFLGFHSTMFFTFFSLLLIGLLSIIFKNKSIYRLAGSFLGALLFFIITNFGVWLSGYYGLTLQGLINCYILAIPFFYGTVLSTLIYSILFEYLLKLDFKKFLSFEKK